MREEEEMEGKLTRGNRDDETMWKDPS